jgi:hypothetical protein
MSESSGPTQDEPSTSSSGTRTSSATPSTSAVAMTTVWLVVAGNGCDDCVFEAFTTVGGRTTSRGSRSQLGDYPIRWRVPTSATRGMAFRFTDLGDALVDGKPAVVVLQYVDRPAGSSLTDAEASSSASARMCWIGTSRPEARLQIRVQVVDVPVSPSPTDGSDPVTPRKLVYANPTVAGTGAWLPTHDGALGHAGVPTCG